MKHTLVFFITLLFTLSSKAQYPEIRYRDPSVQRIYFGIHINASDSAIIAAGFTSDSTGIQKRFILKLDTAGNILNALNSDVSWFDGCSTSDGGYLLTGANYPDDYTCLIKTDVNFNIQWIKKISKNPCLFGTGDGPNVVRIGQTIYYAHLFEYCNQTYGIHLFKTDESGNILAQTVIGDSITYALSNLHLNDIYTTSDSHLVITGSFGGNISRVAYITLDTNFTILSSTSHRFDGYNRNSIVSSAKLNDGSILICGEHRDTWNNFAPYNYFMKFSPEGNVQFVKAIESIPDKALLLIPEQLSEIKYALMGKTYDTLSGDGVPISVLIDSSGNYLSSQYENLDASYWGLWNPIKVINSSLYIIGSSPKLGTTYIAKTDLNLMGSCFPAPLSVSITPIANVIDSAVQLYHSNPYAYSLSDTVFQFYPISLVTDNFCEWLSVEQQQVQQEFVLSPNPTTGKVFISNLDATLIEVEIFNLLGKKVFSCIPVQNEIDFSSLQPGIYILQIHAGEKLLRSKVVKE